MSDTLEHLESRLFDCSQKVDRMIELENKQDGCITPDDVIHAEIELMNLQEKVDLCRAVKIETLGFDSSSIDPDECIRAVITAQNLLLHEINEIFSNRERYTRVRHRIRVLLRTIEFLGFVVGIRRKYGASVDVLNELRVKTDDNDLASELSRVSALVTLKIGKAA